jgi:hypothetical protein
MNRVCVLVAHYLQFVIPVCPFQLGSSEADPHKGATCLSCCPTSRPLQGLLYGTQLLVRHIAHHHPSRSIAASVPSRAPSLQARRPAPPCLVCCKYASASAEPPSQISSDLSRLDKREDLCIEARYASANIVFVACCRYTVYRQLRNVSTIKSRE